MEFSNKSLVILAVGVLVLSIFGTSLSLNLLSDVSPQAVSNTGFVNFDTGTVNLSVNSTVSIVLTDDVIDFGSCNLASGSDRLFNASLDGSGVAESNCTGSFPDNLTVQNDGNVNANVTVKIGSLPTATYTDAAGAVLYYDTVTNSTNGGCNATNDAPWTSFGGTGEYNACKNLTYSATANSFVMNVALNLPYTASNGAGTTTTVTFTAYTATV